MLNWIYAREPGKERERVSETKQNRTIRQLIGIFSFALGPAKLLFICENFHSKHPLSCKNGPNTNERKNGEWCQLVNGGPKMSATPMPGCTPIGNIFPDKIIYSAVGFFRTKSAWGIMVVVVFFAVLKFSCSWLVKFISLRTSTDMANNIFVLFFLAQNLDIKCDWGEMVGKAKKNNPQLRNGDKLLTVNIGSLFALFTGNGNQVMDFNMWRKGNMWKKPKRNSSYWERKRERIMQTSSGVCVCVWICCQRSNSGRNNKFANNYEWIVRVCV